MTTWTHERGHLVANDDAGGVLLRLQADASFSPLADLLNADQALGRLLLAGYGEGAQKRAEAQRSHQAQLGHRRNLFRRDDEVIE